MASQFTVKYSSFILAENAETKMIDGKLCRKMQVIRTGTFTDPRYGKFEISNAMLSDMVKNFTDGIRGITPALDYGHKSDEKAAGWFKEVVIEKGDKDFGLYAFIEMTPSGQKVLDEKEYGYLSADFDSNYKDNESGKKFGCVLLGAGLTNRPVIKHMNSVIELSEKAGKKGDDEMDEKELADFKALASTLKCGSAADLKKKLAKMKDMDDDSDDGADAKKAKQKLSEMTTQLTLEQEKNKVLDAQVKKAAKDAEFTKLLTEGKACEAQREAFLEGDMVKFVTLAEPMKTKTTGNGGGGAGAAGKDADDEILELAEKAVKEKKLSMREAISFVLSENPKLAEKRNQEK